MIFARDIDSNLTSLVKKIDAATQANSSSKMGSFVVFLANDEKAMETKLKDFAEKENIKSIVLTIDNVAGPQGYEIAKDAEVTVILYNKKTVMANHAFRKGELDAKAIEAIIKDIPKIIVAKDAK